MKQNTKTVLVSTTAGVIGGMIAVDIITRGELHRSLMNGSVEVAAAVKDSDIGAAVSNTASAVTNTAANAINSI